MAQWFVAAKRADFDAISRKYGISPVLARIIRNRDIIKDEEIAEYLRGTEADMHSPWLLKDMDRAVDIILSRIRAGVRIRVIGDYDVDGICSTYILHKGLSLCGAEADTVIPHRMKDGYGLNDHLIEEAHKDGIDTIVTCDNGIAAESQIRYGKSLGMTIVVTDHHEVPFEEIPEGGRKWLLPPADAIVDPKQEGCAYPFPSICGAVVACKLIQALFEKLAISKEPLEELLEFAAFATICDVMELQHENRIIVKQGLKRMQDSRNAGLRALLEVNGIEGRKLSAYHIGYILGPCLNATGRLDTAARALELLQVKEHRDAVCLAAELKHLNDSRKDMTEKWLAEAVGQIEKSSLGEDKVLVVFLPECHESLAGIIAGRIREKYHRPSFVLTRGEEGVKGSARSIEAWHVFEEMTRVKQLFTKYGGHKLAAGLSMEERNVPLFRQRINELCTLTDADFEERVHIDVPMPVSYVTKDFIEELELLEPFGCGNHKPVFAEKNIRFLSGRILGKNANVGKYAVADAGGNRYELMYFGDLEKFDAYIEEKFGNSEKTALYCGKAAAVELAVTYFPSLNTFNGKTSLQIVMQQYR